MSKAVVKDSWTSFKTGDRFAGRTASDGHNEVVLALGPTPGFLLGAQACSMEP